MSSSIFRLSNCHYQFVGYQLSAHHISYLCEPGGQDLAEADVAVVELQHVALAGRAASLAQPPGHQRLPVTCVYAWDKSKRGPPVRVEGLGASHIPVPNRLLTD